MSEKNRNTDTLIAAFAGALVGAFLLGIFLFFFGVLMPSGVVISTDDHYVREWVAALSGWVAAGVAGYIGWTTLIPLQKQQRDYAASAKLDLLAKELDASQKLLSDLSKIHIFISSTRSVAMRGPYHSRELKDLFNSNVQRYPDYCSDFMESFRQYLRHGFVFDLKDVSDVLEEKDNLIDKLQKFQDYLYMSEINTVALCSNIESDAEKILKVIDRIVARLSGLAGGAFTALVESKRPFRE